MSDGRAHGESPEGVIVGRITIVQEDRIRVMDAAGRGYLFTVAPRRASARQLEAWRDAGTRLTVEYRGQPDAGAVATSLRAAG